VLGRKVPAHRIRPKVPISRAEFEAALEVLVDELADELELGLGIVHYVAERGAGAPTPPAPLPVPSIDASCDGRTSSSDRCS
jgi:hypothetical protein